MKCYNVIEFVINNEGFFYCLFFFVGDICGVVLFGNGRGFRFIGNGFC